MEDCDLIDFLISRKYGWEKFASSVRASGGVTPAQRATMEKMKRKIDWHENYLVPTRNIGWAMCDDRTN